MTDREQWTDNRETNYRVIEERNTDINAVNNICIKQSGMGRYTREN